MKNEYMYYSFHNINSDSVKIRGRELINNEYAE